MFLLSISVSFQIGSGKEDGDDRERQIIKVFAPAHLNFDSQPYKSVTVTPDISADYILSNILKKYMIEEPYSKYCLVLVVGSNNGTC